MLRHLRLPKRLLYSKSESHFILALLKNIIVSSYWNWDDEIMQAIHKEIEKDLTIPFELLKEADLGEDISIVVKPNLILIKPKSVTEKYRGIVKDASLSMQELEEFNFYK